MKKMMLALAVVAVASAAQAFSYNWTTGPVIEYGGDMSDPGTQWIGGKYYLMQGNAAACEAAVNAILAATDFATEFNNQVAGAVNYGTYNATTYAMGDAKLGSWDAGQGGTVWEAADPGAAQKFYQLILGADGKSMYVSEVADSMYTTVGLTAIPLYNTGYTTFGDDVKTYQGAGWYTAVPEPTSGLLLLLGVAGLALRRRRA